MQHRASEHSQGTVGGLRADPLKLERARDFRKSLNDAEAVLWSQLRGNKLKGLHFRRQQVVAGFIVDFYCHSAGLVIEVDGAVHATQLEYDTERDKRLRARGLRILRFTNDDVLMRLPVVLSSIARAISDRA